MNCASWELLHSITKCGKNVQRVNWWKSYMLLVLNYIISSLDLVSRNDYTCYSTVNIVILAVRTKDCFFYLTNCECKHWLQLLRFVRFPICNRLYFDNSPNCFQTYKCPVSMEPLVVYWYCCLLPRAKQNFWAKGLDDWNQVEGWSVCMIGTVVNKVNVSTVFP